MNKRNFKRVMLSLLFIGTIVMTLPKTAEAASLKTLKNGKNYSYDIDNDGKKETIKIRQTKSYSTDGTTERKIYVNGKKKMTALGCKGAVVYAFTSGKKTVLINEYIYGDGGRDLFAYQHSGSKYKSERLTNDGCFYSTPKVSGDSLKIVSEPKGSWWLDSFQNFSELPFQCYRKWSISRGKLVCSAKYASITGRKSYKAKKSFKTGKTQSTISKGNGPKVRAGQKVTLEKMYYEDDYYYRISVNGKTGWFKDSKSIQFS